MTGRNRTGTRQPVWFVRPAHLKWLVVMIGLIVVYEVFGTPHLLFQYQWNGSESSPRYWRCDYVGQFSQRIVPRDGKCPLIRFFKSAGDDHGQS